jgi:hypothetical protein
MKPVQWSHVLVASVVAAAVVAKAAAAVVAVTVVAAVAATAVVAVVAAATEICFSSKKTGFWAGFFSSGQSSGGCANGAIHFNKTA